MEPRVNFNTKKSMAQWTAFCIITRKDENDEIP